MKGEEAVAAEAVAGEVDDDLALLARQELLQRVGRGPAPGGAAGRRVEQEEEEGELVGAGVDTQLALDWLALRRAKKLPLTATAMRAIDDPTTLTIAAVLAPRARAWRKLMTVSYVSPDCEIAITRALLSESCCP